MANNVLHYLLELDFMRHINTTQLLNALIKMNLMQTNRKSTAS